MRMKWIFIIIIAILLILFFSMQEKNKEGIEMKTIKNLSLITIYDNYQHNPELKTGWGFSCLVKTENKTLLFDTGADSETLLSNMKKLKIEPLDVDLIILSHIHGDHVGGLAGFLERNSDVTVYIPASFPDSFRNNIKKVGAKYVDVSGPVKITDSVGTTGELEGPPKEQSLLISTPTGLVIITGCAHPGVVHIVEEAKKQTGEDIYLVLGGFHLGGASDSTLRNIISSFREIGVKKVAPCHCSGEHCRELFKEEYKDDFIENGVGKIVEVKKEKAFIQRNLSSIMINSSTYGSITINDVTYNHDVYILPSGKVEEREYGHTFTKEQVEHVLKESPEIVFIGKGTSGMASLSNDARAELEKKKIKIIEADTPDIKDKFNKFSKSIRCAAIIHVTC